MKGNHLFPIAGTSTSILQPGQPEPGDYKWSVVSESERVKKTSKWLLFVSLLTGAAFYFTPMRWWMVLLHCKHGSVIPVILNVCGLTQPDFWYEICLAFWARELYNNGVLLIRVTVDNLVSSPDFITEALILGWKHCMYVYVTSVMDTVFERGALLWRKKLSYSKYWVAENPFGATLQICENLHRNV